MHTLAYFAVSLTMAAAAATDTLPAWLQFGVATLFIGAWWVERKDRKEAEERTREVQREATERLTTGLEKLYNAIEVLRQVTPRGQ